MHDTVYAAKEIIEEASKCSVIPEQSENLSNRIQELERQVEQNPAAEQPAIPTPDDGKPPTAVEQPATPAPDHAAPPAAQEQAKLDGVLIVDDSKVLQLRLKSTITQLGYQIVGVADDGRSGAQMALARNPKLVILDYSMPVMNGLECLKVIRSQRRDIKVIICSATITEEMSRELAKYGVDALLTKPIQFNRFIETVKSLMIAPDGKDSGGK